MPETDVNMRAEVRQRGVRACVSLVCHTVRHLRCVCLPSPPAPAQNLATPLHYASGLGGVDHPAIVKARASCRTRGARAQAHPPFAVVW